MATVKIVTVDGTVELRGLTYITIFNDGVHAGYDLAGTQRFIPKERIVAITSTGTLNVQWKTKWNHDGTHANTAPEVGCSAVLGL